MSDNQNTAKNADNAFSGLDMMDMDDLFNDQDVTGAKSADISIFRDVPLTVTLEVASTEVTLGELSQAGVGDVLPLDKVIGEPLDVKVNGILFARAEVVTVDGRYGLKFVSGKLRNDGSATE